MASSQQIADLLLLQWQTLWPLPAAERMKIIEETRLDVEFEEQLDLVHRAMEAA